MDCHRRCNRRARGGPRRAVRASAAADDHVADIDPGCPPELIAFHAASLDHPGHFRPQVVTYTVSAPTWDRIDPALRSFERMPG